MAKYLVIGLQSYDFKDRDGKSIKGSNIFFLDKAQDNGFVGYKTGKMVIPESFIKAFTTVPGYYDLDFSVKVGAGGKPAAKLESVGFISAAKIDEKATSAK